MQTDRSSDSARRVNAPALERLALTSGLALLLIITALIFALRHGGVGLGAWVLPVGLLGVVAALLLLGALLGLRRPSRLALSGLTQQESASLLPGIRIWAGTLGVISSGAQLALSLFRTEVPPVWWYLLNAAVLALSSWMIIVGRRQRKHLAEREKPGEVAKPVES
jgi:hypothetical protein